MNCLVASFGSHFRRIELLMHTFFFPLRILTRRRRKHRTFVPPQASVNRDTNMDPSLSSSASELFIDDGLLSLKSLPVHASKYNNILKWHIKPGAQRVRHTYIYKTMQLVPLYTIADSFCVAYWLEHPAVIIKFILGKLTSVDHSAVAGLADFMMVRAIKTRLFIRVVHSTKLTALEKIPSNGFLRNTCFYTMRCWSGLAVFPGATPNMLPIIRLATYLGLAHPPYETFNSDQEYDQHIRQMSFEMMGSDISEVEASSWAALVALVRCIAKPEPKHDICLPFPVHPGDTSGLCDFQQMRFPNHSIVSLPADEAIISSEDDVGVNGIEVLGVDSNRRSKSPANRSKLLPIIEDESE
jgi:hypothetical protein